MNQESMLYGYGNIRIVTKLDIIHTAAVKTKLMSRLLLPARQ